MTAYLIRAVSVLIIMSLGAFVLVKLFRKYNPNAKSASNIEIISSLRITGRDIFLVVHCGPDVIAFVTGSGGSFLMGRWSYEDWLKSIDS